MSEPPAQAAYAHNGRPVSAEQFYAIACDPRRHVAVEACAGAGKTWMLVSRIVRALLDGTDAAQGQLQVAPHEILAITFTKRAASEMRERLVRWLREFADAPDAVLVKELHDRGVRSAPGSAAEQADVQRLAGLYRKVLRHGRPVQIRTFHSWFAALLRAAPLAVLQQLELPLNYELLEDDEEASRLVWRRFYQVLLEQPQSRADFEALVLQHGRAQTERALSGALDKRIEFTLADRAGVVDMSVQHFALLFPALADLPAPCAALASDATRKRWLAWAKALGQETNKTPRKAAQLIVEAFASAGPASASDLESRLAELRQALFVADENRLTHHLQKYPAAQEAQLELVLLCAAAHQHGTWLYQQRMARLGRVLIAEYAALKRARGWVDMTDVERSALVLLSDPVLSGWVQERLDARVKHLLIDEFQDTNPLQWQALFSWLGSYAGARGKAPSVFIVGDPKQSIYRFRRAEPQVFVAAQDFVAQGLGGDLLSCDHTRRNATQVIATVNAAMRSAQQTDAYAGFREHTTSSTQTGLVGFLPPIPRPQGEAALGRSDLQAYAPDEPWRDSLTTPRTLPEETLRNLEARQVAQWIAQQVEAGLAPQDVMVLSRRRAGLLPLQQALRGFGIPAQIGEKTGLIDCCEVQDLVALLDVLVSNQHDLSLARALKSPLFSISDETLVALALRCRADRQPWFSLLQQDWTVASGLQGVGPTLLRWRGWLATLPPHDALQAIYSEHDVLARFAMAAPATQRDSVLANLRSLLVAALQLGGGRYATPYALVRVLKAGGALAPPSVDEAAVRLLTIHGAKGLEAQAVVLLDTDTPERTAETMGVLVDWPGHAAQPRKFVFMASEKYPPACAVQTLEDERAGRRREELNALYVALTRARHTLVISSITPHREAAGSWWQRLSGLMPDQIAVLPMPAIGVIRNRSQAQFHLKALPTVPAIPPPDTASGQDGAYESPAAPDQDTEVARVGKAMHRLLEWGDTSTANAAAAAAEFGLGAGQGMQAAAMAQRILQGQGAWVWDNAALAWQANEVELMVQGEPLRLDRLVQRKDTGEWWVLDFKSSPAPQHQPALMAQLQAYRSAVQDSTPGAVVRAAFLTAQGDLIELAESTRMTTVCTP